MVKQDKLFQQAISLVFIFLISGLSISVQGHHSFAIYDAENPRTLSGVLREHRWTNPHAAVVLTVTNDDGSETDWVLDQGPVNMLSRQGWTRTTLEPGDLLSVEFHPLHSGQPGGLLQSFEFITKPQVELSGTGTIIRQAVPEPVQMSEAEARNFNGVWANASGGIHFDTLNSRSRRDQEPPLRPEYMAQWQQRWADGDAGVATSDPTARCIPPGFPRFLTMVLPGEILQAEHQLNWYAEFSEATIRVFLDGRQAPEDLVPSYNGFSTGVWEDNTLVVKTTGLRGDTLVDTTGVPHSDQLTVSMHMSKVTPDFFKVDVELVDPVVFYEPWTTTKYYTRLPESEFVQEYACQAGNRFEVNAAGEIEVIFE
ncbi:MAG: hypothetical protein HOH14_06230 [Gammaproteobacteria bacterium]|jgi:hypothetical protein|nr:hypothetical protein [Gammaproteobacteria bacterium]